MDVGSDELGFQGGGWKRGGGIAVFWRRGVDVTLCNISKYHIDMDVKRDDDFQWRFTGIYREAQHGEKHKTWDDLRNLRVTPMKPWLCAGDFNEILVAHKKEGGRPKCQIHMDRFRDALEECQLHDLGFEGDIFTWRNHNHNAEDYIRECLDRAVARMICGGAIFLQHGSSMVIHDILIIAR